MNQTDKLIEDRQAVPLRLLDLPLEILLCICKLVVVYERPILINPSQQDGQELSSLRLQNYYPIHSQPALTRACRTLRGEGLNQYYHANLFFGLVSHYNCEDQAKRWLRTACGRAKRLYFLDWAPEPPCLEWIRWHCRTAVAEQTTASGEEVVDLERLRRAGLEYGSYSRLVYAEVECAEEEEDGCEASFDIELEG